MLKQRVITAVILGLLVLSAVLWAPVWLFSLLIAGVTLYGAWEWSNFCRISHQSRLIYVAVGGGIMGVISLIGLNHLLTSVLILAGLFLVIGHCYGIALSRRITLVRLSSKVDYRYVGVNSCLGCSDGN